MRGLAHKMMLMSISSALNQTPVEAAGHRHRVSELCVLPSCSPASFHRYRLYCLINEATECTESLSMDISMAQLITDDAW